MKIRATLLVFVLIVTNFLSLAAPVNAIPREEVTTYHLHSDHLGSVRRITDENGKVIESRDYLPFGRQVATDPDGEPETTLGFTGHERDDHGSGAIDDWDYMHARYYSPWLGRFGSVDPVLGSADVRIPQTWNRYSYGRNNPVVFADPDGEFAVALIVGGLIVVSVVAVVTTANPSYQREAIAAADSVGASFDSAVAALSDRVREAGEILMPEGQTSTGAAESIEAQEASEIEDRVRGASEAENAVDAAAVVVGLVAGAAKNKVKKLVDKIFGKRGEDTSPKPEPKKPTKPEDPKL